jgi:hypothetical protein
VVAAGATGVWVSARSRMKAVPPSAAFPSLEEAALAEAEKLCAAGDCETAHARLDEAVSPASRWRDTQEFRHVEGAWAESLIRRADNSADLSEKRQLYQRVAQTTGVDPAHRKTAADRLQQLDAVPVAAASTNFVLPSASAVGMPAGSERPRAREDAGAVIARSEPARKAATGVDPALKIATSTAPANVANVLAVDERERQLALQNTPEAKSVLKQQLESRVYGGKASDSEIRLLISTCKELGD